MLLYFQNNVKCVLHRTALRQITQLYNHFINKIRQLKITQNKMSTAPVKACVLSRIILLNDCFWMRLILWPIAGSNVDYRGKCFFFIVLNINSWKYVCHQSKSYRTIFVVYPFFPFSSWFFIALACLLGSSKDVSILCAGQAYSGSVDNWHQFFDVFHQHPIEKPLIPFLDAHQVHVPVRKRKINELNRIEGDI